MSLETPVQTEPQPQITGPVPEDSAAVVRAQTTSLRRKAVRGGLVLVVTRLLMQVLAWVVTLLVARLLMPYDYGVITTGVIFVNLTDMLAHAGMGRALVHKADLEAADVAEAFTVNLLLGAALYGLLFAVAGPASLWLNTPDFAGLLRVLSLLLLVTPFCAIPIALLERDLRLPALAPVHLISTFVQGSLVLGLAIARWGYWSLAVGALGGKLFEAAALIWVAGWRPRLRMPGKRARGLLAFGIHVSLGSLMWFIYTNADYAAIGRLAGPIVLGYYALAFQLISLPVEKLNANVAQVVFPVFCRLQTDRPRLRNWYLRLTVLLGFFSTPALVGMILVADDGFAVVFGAKWLPAVLPFRLLSAAGITMIYGATVPLLISALGRPDVNMRYSFAGLLVYPACFFTAGWLYGMVGVCLVWSFVYPLMVAALLWRTKPLTGIGPLMLLRAQVPVFVAVAFMAVTVLLVQWGLAGVDQPGIRLAVAIVVGAISYAGWILATARHTILADLRGLLRDLKS